MLDLDMGKYAVFVWPAYAVSAVVIAAMIADSLARARRWKALARRDDAPDQPDGD